MKPLLFFSKSLFDGQALPAETHDLRSLDDMYHDPFKEGYSAGQVTDNPHKMYRGDRHAYALGAHAKANGVYGAVRKRRGDNWSIGDQHFSVKGDKVSPLGQMKKAVDPQQRGWRVNRSTPTLNNEGQRLHSDFALREAQHGIIRKEEGRDSSSTKHAREIFGRAASRLARHVQGIKDGEELTLPQNHEDYFHHSSATQHIPLYAIEPVRSGGYAQSESHLALARVGLGNRRQPVALEDQGNGKYKVLHGHNTYMIAQKHGWDSVPAHVLEKGKAFAKSIGELSPAHDADADPKTQNFSPPAPRKPKTPPTEKPAQDDVWIGRHKDAAGGHVYTHAGQSYSGKDGSERAYNAMRKNFPKTQGEVPHPSQSLGGGHEESWQRHLPHGATMADHDSGKVPYSPERQQVHRQILDGFLHGKAKRSDSPHIESDRKPGRPVAVFMTGGSGSGKGFVKKHLYGKHEDLVNIDPDDIKKELAKHDGLDGHEEHHPGYWHEESSLLSKRLQHEAHQKGKSYIFDGVGDNAGKVKQKMDGALASGHEVHARRVDTPVKLAWYRNATRARTVSPQVLHDAHDGARGAWPEVAAHAEKNGGTSAVFGQHESGKWQDHEMDKKLSKGMRNGACLRYNKSASGRNVMANRNPNDGRKCRISTGDHTVFVGHIEGDKFIMEDKISNGASWRALTHRAPDYGPIAMSKFINNGDKIEYL